MAHPHHNTEKRSFTHLTEFDRGQIQALRKQGKTLQAIADEVDVTNQPYRGSLNVEASYKDVPI